MKPHDAEAFTEQWLACYELYGKTCSDAAVALAFQVLSKFELEDVSRALAQHAMDPDAGRFPPKPADLVKFITGDPESRPLAAWTLVDGAIRGAGPYRSVVFDDPITMAVISGMGGWVQLCEVLDKDLPFKRNEFCTRYRGFMLSAPKEFPAKLQGLNNRDEPPMLIGNPVKAQQVLNSGSTAPRLPMKSLDQLMAGALEHVTREAS
jgi:hypothetical protein